MLVNEPQSTEGSKANRGMVRKEEPTVKLLIPRGRM